MKKIFTLLVALVACVATMNAKNVFDASWSSWGSGCTVDGSTVTYTSAWAGAGYWIGGYDASNDEVLVVVFSQPTTGKLKFVAQFQGCSVSSTDVMIEEGTKIAKIDLSDAALAGSLNDLNQVFLQSATDAASCEVAQVYAGTNAEYEADAAGNEPVKPETSNVDLKGWSGWHGEGLTVNEDGTLSVEFKQEWGGAAKWLGAYNASDFDYAVFELAEPAAFEVMGVVQYHEADGEGENNVSVSIPAGVTQGLLELDAARKNAIDQVAVQNAEVGTVKVKAVYFATKDYVTAIATPTVAKPAFNENAPLYNLAGQRVSKNYKGVVIQNGRKYIVK